MLEDTDGSQDQPTPPSVAVSRGDALHCNLLRIACADVWGLFSLTSSHLSVCKGEPTIVLQVASVAKLQSLKDAADAAGLVACAVRDAGRTQVAAGSMTCCAFGPAPTSVVDSITASLALL